MNVIRKSTGGFDADRLLGNVSRTSFLDAVKPNVQVTDGANAFYRRSPQGEMSMAKMDHLARVRLGLLRLIDKKLQSFDGGSMDSFLEEQSLNVVTSIPQDFKESFEEDLASHYILRLGLSKSQEFIDWFVKQEEALFLSKLRQGGGEFLHLIMRTSPELSHLGRDVVSRQSNSTEFESIRRCTPFPGDQATMFYKIHFTEIPAYLISRRSVVIVKGTAYVPEKEMIALIGRKYRDYLAQAMMTATRERANLIAHDERLKQIADRISPAALLASGKLSNLSPTEKLSLSNFNLLLGRSLPPCMRVAVESMRPTAENRNAGKHLKNTGRNQLAPFLRTAGMSMEDSLQWWKTEFTRGSQMDADKFDKNYTYNIKWVYGKAGRMKSAAPMSCSTVVNLEYPSHDQTHGCPFKVFDETKIATMLRGWLTKAGVSLDDKEGRIKDIARKAAGQGMTCIFHFPHIPGHEYQIACVDWFQLTHEGHSGDGVGNHPNTYFSYVLSIQCMHVYLRESVAFWGEKEGKPADANQKMEESGGSAESLSQAHAG